MSSLSLVTKLQPEIARDSDKFNLEREGQHDDEIEERKFETELKRRRLDENMDQKSKSSTTKRLPKRLIKNWKCHRNKNARECIELI